jgi:hypothetical protein
LADLNIKHWQLQSDLDNITHVAMVPLLVRSGDDEQKPTKISSSAIIDLPIDGRLYYVEHTGAAIGAGRAALSALESQMEVLGAEILLTTPGDKTATQTSVETAQSQSKLKKTVRNTEDATNLLLYYMGRWINTDFKGSVKIFSDFAPQSTADAGTLINANTLGIISKQRVYEELQARGILNQDITWEEEQARILESVPTLS